MDGENRYAGHPPGPWEWVWTCGYWWIRDSNGGIVCDDGSYGGEYDGCIIPDSSLGNLLADAPKLLAQRDRLRKALIEVCRSADAYIEAAENELEAADVEACNWPRHEQLVHDMDIAEAAIKECEE